MPAGCLSYRTALMNDSIPYVLGAPTAARACDTVDAWFRAYRSLAQSWPQPFDRAVLGGFSADRLAWAFASGYQAALHVLVPSLPSNTLSALCATEEGGNRPRAIRTTISPRADRGTLVIRGEKRWATLGDQCATLLVVAREHDSPEERPRLRVVRIDATAPGIHISAKPPPRFTPEVAHAKVRFDRVSVARSALLEGDGYERYLKPFRTIEDVHVHAALLAYLLREARRLSWPAPWLERCLVTLNALGSIADADPLAPATHIVLAGAIDAVRSLAEEATNHWAGSNDAPAFDRWQRDKPVLDVAATARTQRRTRAWEQLNSA
jgi:acyl-CoA dehydrogenase